MLKSALLFVFITGVFSCLAARSFAGADTSATVNLSGTPAGGGSDGPNSGISQSQSLFSDGTNSAQAQVDMFTLDTSAALDLTPGQTDGHAQATASYSDTFTILAPYSGTADFVFTVDGTLTPNSDYSLTGSLNGQVLASSAQWVYEFPGFVFDTVGFVIPFTPGVSFDLQVSATSNAYETDSSAGASSSNFFDTARLQSIVITGDSSVTITSDIPCAYQSYVVTPGPLPASLWEGAALFAVVLGGSLMQHRRRNPAPHWQD